MFVTSNALKSGQYTHGFFTRNGGVSEGIFSSLNCGFNDVEPKENILKNREIVANKLGFKASDLQMVKQIHSNIAVTIDHENQGSSIEADAMVTTTRGVLLGIITADCCPVLFADKQNNIVGAAHAGWRGAFSGILQNTVAAMGALGSVPHDIVAVIGPSISQESYEVDLAFKESFIQQNPKNSQYFINGKAFDKFMFDLKGYCYDILQAIGVGVVEDLKRDTYIEQQGFYSFRRSTHDGTAKNGCKFGQLSVIGIKA